MMRGAIVTPLALVAALFVLSGPAVGTHTPLVDSTPREIREWLVEPDKWHGIVSAGELMRDCTWVNTLWGEGFCTGYFRGITEMSGCPALSQLQLEFRGVLNSWVEGHPEKEDRPAPELLKRILSEFCG